VVSPPRAKACGRPCTLPGTKLQPFGSESQKSDGRIKFFRGVDASKGEKDYSLSSEGEKERIPQGEDIKGKQIGDCFLELEGVWAQKDAPPDLSVQQQAK